MNLGDKKLCDTCKKDLIQKIWKADYIKMYQYTDKGSNIYYFCDIECLREYFQRFEPLK